MTKRKTLVSWSSGKDSAWALHALRQRPDVEVTGLFCTVNRRHGRVAMHAVREGLLRLQARRVGLPLQVIEIPDPCSEADYAARMAAFVREANARGVQCLAFGDLFLENVRRYREERLAGTGIAPVFPLWGSSTRELCRQMLSDGLRARITCIDSRHLPAAFVGREYDATFLEEIPRTVDPCGENGEFHTFVYDGPMFRQPLRVRRGEVVHRDEFVFADLLCTGTPKPWT